MAYEDGADVIACTFGVTSGSADDPLSQVADRIVEEGVVVTMAMGDSGTSGPYYSSDGASSRKALGVASVEPDSIPQVGFGATVTMDGDSVTVKVGYLRLVGNAFPESVNGWPIVPLTMDSDVSNDACDTLSVNIPDYSQAIPLIRLGGCDPQTKQKNLEAVGLQHLIFYYDNMQDISENFGYDGSTCLVISPKSGAGIISTYLAGGSVTGNFTERDGEYWVSRHWPWSNAPSASSEWGPVSDLSIKPDIAAPGNLVYSTYPRPDKDSWNYAGGTEMASAYVAGVAALYIGHYGGRRTNPNYNATDLTMRIISRGSTVYYWEIDANNPNTFIAPVAQSGTGLVNATKVLEYTSSLSFVKFELRDTPHFERYQTVQITNNADVDVSYTFGVLLAAGFETWLPSESRILGSEGLVAIKLYPSVTLPSGTFDVGAGQTKIAKFDFTAPDYSSNLPLYSGNIIINSTLGESLAVPYLGLAASLRDAFPSIFYSGYPYILSGRKSLNISANPTWSFDLSLSKQEFPKLFIENVWSIAELRWDIFEASFVEDDWIYPPVVGKNKYVGSATYWIYSDDAFFYDPDDYGIYNTTKAFPIKNVARTVKGVFYDDVPPPQFWWLGKMADGTAISSGKYVMRVAAVRPFGDTTKASDWDSWIQTFTVS